MATATAAMIQMSQYTHARTPESQQFDSELSGSPLSIYFFFCFSPISGAFYLFCLFRWRGARIVRERNKNKKPIRNEDLQKIEIKREKITSKRNFSCHLQSASHFKAYLWTERRWKKWLIFFIGCTQVEFDIGMTQWSLVQLKIVQFQSSVPIYFFFSMYFCWNASTTIEPSAAAATASERVKLGTLTMVLLLRPLYRMPYLYHNNK